MILNIVVPCYNEEDMLEITYNTLGKLLKDLKEEGLIDNKSQIVFVDDGSKDKTWSLIESYSTKDKQIRGIKLSRNRGHQNAVLCGMLETYKDCDAVITIDADLQDDINCIKEMVIKYGEGYEVVYGVRNKRTTDTFFKRFTAEGYYKVLQLLGCDIIYNHADYRLMSSKVLSELEKFEEVNLFLRGMLPLVGFKSTQVYYERKERVAGESKYPLKKMLALAWDGITSLSVKPLRLISFLGFLIFFVAIVYLIYCFIRHLGGATVTGWTSMVTSVWALGGLQLLAIGVLGEYIGKVYMETKHRPRYIVEKDINIQREYNRSIVEDNAKIIDIHRDSLDKQ